MRNVRYLFIKYQSCPLKKQKSSRYYGRYAISEVCIGQEGEILSWILGEPRGSRKTRKETYVLIKLKSLLLTSHKNLSIKEEASKL